MQQTLSRMQDAAEAVMRKTELQSY